MSDASGDGRRDVLLGRVDPGWTPGRGLGVLDGGGSSGGGGHGDVADGDEVLVELWVAPDVWHVCRRHVGRGGRLCCLCGVAGA